MGHVVAQSGARRGGQRLPDRRGHARQPRADSQRLRSVAACRGGRCYRRRQADPRRRHHAHGAASRRRVELPRGAACRRHAPHGKLLDARRRNQLSAGTARHAGRGGSQHCGSRRDSRAADSRIAPARGSSFHIERAQVGAPRQTRQGSRHLRSHAASLHAARRKCWRVRHKFQDEPAAALSQRPRGDSRGAGGWHCRCDRHRSRPHALHEKQVEFERAAFGITGFETALALADHQAASRTQNST